MAIKLTYSDGQESDYDDDTAWEVDNGVLKLGKEEGKWSVLLSPSHWAVVEVDGAKAHGTSTDDKDDDDSDDSDDESEEKDEDKGEKSKHKGDKDKDKDDKKVEKSKDD
jgi:hypothetical protein